MIVTLKDDKVLLLEQVKVLTQRNNQLDKALRQSRQQVAHQEHHVQDDKTSLLKQQVGSRGKGRGGGSVSPHL